MSLCALVASVVAAADEFLFCKGGLVAFTLLLNTDGALACLFMVAGGVAATLLETVDSLTESGGVFVVVLSALRRAGFFLGFLTVGLFGCVLTDVGPFWPDAAMLI